MDNLTEKLMCVNCTEDEYLKKLIQSEGERGRCDYCEEEDTCISLEELAPRVKEIFEERFRAVQHFGGKDPADVFQEIGSFFNDETGRNILHMLESEGDIYDYGERFVRKEIGSVKTKDTWDTFCSYVKHRDRYFSEEAPKLLDELFVKLIPFRSEKNRSPFRNLRPSKNRRIYRGRVANSHSELRRIILNPAIELGPPPAKIAPAGRLNPIGIPVFYGAFHRKTCISELRPFVGGEVITGEFRLRSTIRVLDLTVLDDMVQEAMDFDPEYETKMDYLAFMQSLHSEIIRPLLPDEEQLEYLPTQYLAAYLSHHFKPAVKGIIYGSSQYGKSKKNITLFSDPHPYDLPLSDSLPTAHSDIFFMGNGEWETYHPRLDKTNYKKYQKLMEEGQKIDYGCGLSFISGSLRVHRITRVEYSTMESDAEPIESEPFSLNHPFGLDAETDEAT